MLIMNINYHTMLHYLMIITILINLFCSFKLYFYAKGNLELFSSRLLCAVNDDYVHNQLDSDLFSSFQI